MKRVDYTGHRFGRLVVLGDAEDRIICECKTRYVRCQCDCGNLHEAPMSKLKNGSSKSCGCYFRETRKENMRKVGRLPKKNKVDFVGKRFCRLQVVAEAKPRHHASGFNRYMLTECICGTVKEVCLSSLKRGAQKSCGCLKRERSGKKGESE
jgi:hypothetical protein